MKRPGFPTAKEIDVLCMLGSDELYGLEIVRRSEGSLHKNTIYAYLGRLLRKGFITAEKDLDPNHHGMPRPRYSLTRKGKITVEYINQLGKCV